MEEVGFTGVVAFTVAYGRFLSVCLLQLLSICLLEVEPLPVPFTRLLPTLEYAAAFPLAVISDQVVTKTLDLVSYLCTHTCLSPWLLQGPEARPAALGTPVPSAFSMSRSRPQGLLGCLSCRCSCDLASWRVASRLGADFTPWAPAVSFLFQDSPPPPSGAAAAPPGPCPCPLLGSLPPGGVCFTALPAGLARTPTAVSLLCVSPSSSQAGGL